MKWKDSSGESGPNQQDATEDYFDEEEYAPFPRSSIIDSVSRFFGHSNFPLTILLAGIGIVALFVLFFLPGREEPSTGSDAALIQAQLGQLEERIAHLEEFLANLGPVESQGRRIEQLKERFDRLEASVAMRMEEWSDKMGAAGQQPVKDASRKPTPTIGSPKPEPVKTSATVRYHIVKKGDTLYNISRSNGLTVEQLRKWNGLDAGALLHPGDKLKVSP